jgi:hypothetical protein
MKSSAAVRWAEKKRERIKCNEGSERYERKKRIYVS